MIINDAGLLIIKKYEGLVDGDPDTPGLDPYLDPIGIPTIGWGSTYDLVGARVTMTTPPVTVDQAEDLLMREISHAARWVTRLIKIRLNENQFSALISFTYNLGSGNLQASTLRMKLNRGDVEGAAEEFPKWRKAGGRILRGLVLRRAAERKLFLS